MEKIEVKGEVTNVMYEAIDGTMFNDQKECELYENTAKCVIKSRIKILKTVDAWDVSLGYKDNNVEIISGTKENIMMYVGLSSWCYNEKKKNAIEDLASFNENDLYMMWYNSEGDVYAAMSKSAFIERINKAIEPEENK